MTTFSIFPWPSTVPNTADPSGFAEQPDRNVAGFQPEIGPTIDRRRTSMATRKMTWTTTLMTEEKFNDLLDFYTDTLGDGVDLFSVVHPRTRRLSIFKFKDAPKIGRIHGRYRSAIIDATLLSMVQAETQAYLDAMDVQPTTQVAFIYDNCIRGMKTSGLWGKATDIRFLGAHDEQAARLLVNAPGTDTLIKVNSPRFDGYQGFKGNGVSSYLTSSRNYSDIALQDDASAFVWSNTHATTGIDLGTAAFGNFTLGSRHGGAIFVRANSAPGAIGLPAPSSTIGLFGWSRSGAATYSIYNDVVAEAKTDASTVNIASPMTILRQDVVYSARQLFFTGLFRHLTATEVVSLRKCIYVMNLQLGALYVPPPPSLKFTRGTNSMYWSAV